ncbi:MAG TPA: hypothetical protein VH643_04245 [Gemmataceae bacterium]
MFAQKPAQPMKPARELLQGFIASAFKLFLGQGSDPGSFHGCDPTIQHRQHRFFGSQAASQILVKPQEAFLRFRGKPWAGAVGLVRFVSVLELTTRQVLATSSQPGMGALPRLQSKRFFEENVITRVTHAAEDLPNDGCLGLGSNPLHIDPLEFLADGEQETSEFFKDPRKVILHIPRFDVGSKAHACA